VQKPDYPATRNYRRQVGRDWRRWYSPLLFKRQDDACNYRRRAFLKKVGAVTWGVTQAHDLARVQLPSPFIKALAESLRVIIRRPRRGTCNLTSKPRCRGCKKVQRYASLAQVARSRASTKFRSMESERETLRSVKRSPGQTARPLTWSCPASRSTAFERYWNSAGPPRNSKSIGEDANLVIVDKRVPIGSPRILTRTRPVLDSTRCPYYPYIPSRR